MARLQHCSSAVLLFVLLSSAGPLGCRAVPAAPMTTSLTPYRHAPRQDLTTSTSFDYWWPYPPWGAQTSTTLPVPTDVSAVGTTLDPLQQTVSTTVAAIMSTVLADNPAASSSGPEPTMSSFPTPSSASGTLVQVTALPPANSSSSVTTRARTAARNRSRGFNIVYLAPLFVVLGGVAGGLCTWLVYCFLPLGVGSRRREQALEPGPRYTPPSRFRHAGTLTPAPIEDENLARPSQSSARPLLEVEPTQPKKGSWISRALSSHSSAPSRRAAPAATAAEDAGDAEDDPFLDGPSPVGAPAAAAGLGRQATSRTTVSRSVTSPDPYGALSDEEDLAPYETLRHKSIRRGILERLKFGSLRRPPAMYERGRTEEDPSSVNASSSVRRPSGNRRGHKRDSSDIKVAEMRSPARTLSADSETTTPSRRPTLLRNRSEVVTSPPGFRMVVEDPESGALTSAPPSRSASPTKEGGPSWGWNLLWAGSPTKERGGDDKFTPLPVRRNLAGKRNSPYTSPSPSPSVSQVIAEYADGGSALALPPIRRIDSSILPASPPMVMSPPLESQLFFGAVSSPDFGSSPSLSLSMPPPTEVKRGYQLQDAGVVAQGFANGAAATANGDKHKKLKTQRSPPSLPFPSTTSSSPFRGRLKKSPTKKTSRSPAHSQLPPTRTLPAVERADSADSVDAPKSTGRGTPAERYAARSSALSKVDEILSRSWSDRELTGVGFPGSPTNFGAGPSMEKLMLMDDDEALNGAGIEQRLAALKAREGS